MGPVVGSRRSHACEYGVLGHTCGGRATTTRPRPNGDRSWHVCARHAAFLDRLRASIIEHADLLARLRDLP